MEIICGIYKIESPSGRIYIGQSVNIFRRWKCNYQNLNCKNQTLLLRSFQKYGVKNHIFSVLEICDTSFLNDREIFYMSKYGCLNSKSGLNLKGGGAKGLLSKETKERMRLSKIGRKHSDATKEKIGNKHRGMIRPKETGIKISLALKGRTRSGSKHSQETKDKIGAANRGKVRSEGLKKSHSMKIKENYATGKTIKIYKYGKDNPFFGRKHSQETKDKISVKKLKRC